MFNILHNIVTLSYIIIYKTCMPKTYTVNSKVGIICTTKTTL